jgi:hypothetical protein
MHKLCLSELASAKELKRLLLSLPEAARCYKCGKHFQGLITEAEHTQHRLSVCFACTAKTNAEASSAFDRLVQVGYVYCPYIPFPPDKVENAAYAIYAAAKIKRLI